MLKLFKLYAGLYSCGGVIEKSSLGQFLCTPRVFFLENRSLGHFLRSPRVFCLREPLSRTFSPFSAGICLREPLSRTFLPFSMSFCLREPPSRTLSSVLRAILSLRTALSDNSFALCSFLSERTALSRPHRQHKQNHPQKQKNSLKKRLLCMNRFWWYITCLVAMVQIYELIIFFYEGQFYSTNWTVTLFC